MAPQAPINPNMKERRPLATECVNPVAAYTLLQIAGLEWATSVKSFDCTPTQTDTLEPINLLHVQPLACSEQ